MCNTTDIEDIVTNVREVQKNSAVDTSSYHHYALFFEAGVIKWWEKVDSHV